MKSMDDYERIFTIQNGNEEINIVHTWKNPYPKMFHKSNEEHNDIIYIEDKKDEKMKIKIYN